MKSRLWLRYVLGTPLIQISCAIIAAGSFAFAMFLTVGPDTPPKPLVASILAIGLFPVVAVGIMRGQRALKERSAPDARGWWLALLMPLAALAGVVALAAS